MFIVKIIFGITIFLLLLLLAVWFSLLKYNRPIPSGIRKVFSTQYDVIITPFVFMIIGVGMFFSMFSYFTWAYFKKIGVNDTSFLMLGSLFVLTSVDLSIAFIINRLFQKFE